MPHAGEEYLRIFRVLREAGTAEVAAEPEHELPGLSAIGRAIHTMLVLRTGRAAEGADVYDFGVRRMDDDAPDAPCLAETHVRPRRPRIGGLVDPVAL